MEVLSILEPRERKITPQPPVQATGSSTLRSKALPDEGGDESDSPETLVPAKEKEGHVTYKLEASDHKLAWEIFLLL